MDKKQKEIVMYVIIGIVTVVIVGGAIWAEGNRAKQSRERATKYQCDKWVVKQSEGDYVWADWQIEVCGKQGMQFDKSKNSNQLILEGRTIIKETK